MRTCRASLSTYLNDAANWRDVHIAPIAPHALAHALNAQRHAPRNNDVLEFVGDRVVNLACALVAATARYTPEQRTWPARRLSSNDTLGRIAWQLGLHTHPATRLDPTDARQVRAWAPHNATNTNKQPAPAPPKVLADLFEAYVGAVYCYPPSPKDAHTPPGARPGAWPTTYAALGPLFSPLLVATTHDVLFALSPEEHDVPAHWLAPDALPWGEGTQREFLAWIAERVCMDSPVGLSKDRASEGKGRGTMSMRDAWHAEVPLPTPTPTPLPTLVLGSQAELEIGTQLLKLWTLDITLALVPEILHARVGGAAFLSMTTTALMSPATLGTLATLLGLAAFLPPEDPAFLAGFDTENETPASESILLLSSVSPMCVGASPNPPSSVSKDPAEKEGPRAVVVAAGGIVTAPGDSAIAASRAGPGADVGARSSTSRSRPPPSAPATMRNGSPPTEPAATRHGDRVTTTSYSPPSSSSSSSRTLSSGAARPRPRPRPACTNSNSTSSSVPPPQHPHQFSSSPSSTSLPNQSPPLPPRFALLPHPRLSLKVPDLPSKTLQTLAHLLLVRLGAFYALHPTRARRFGLRWFSPIVRWVVRRLGRRLRYRAAIPDSMSSELNTHSHVHDDDTSNSPRKSPCKKITSKRADMHMDKLLEAFEDLALTATGTTTKAGGVPGVKTYVKESQAAEKKSKIKLSAAWLDRGAADPDAVDKVDAVGQDLDARTKAAPAAANASMGHMDNTADSNAEDSLVSRPGSLLQADSKPPGTGTIQAVQLAVEDIAGLLSDSDMEFSSEDGYSGSDMEFSDSEFDENEDTDGHGHYGREEQDEEDDSDAVVKALGAGFERLRLDLSGSLSSTSLSHDPEAGAGASTSTSSISHAHGAVETANNVGLGAEKKQEEQGQEQDSGEDMEFSSSDEDVADGNGKEGSSCAPTSLTPLPPRIRRKARMQVLDVVKV